MNIENVLYELAVLQEYLEQIQSIQGDSAHASSFRVNAYTLAKDIKAAIIRVEKNQTQVNDEIIWLLETCEISFTKHDKESTRAFLCGGIILMLKGIQEKYITEGR